MQIFRLDDDPIQCAKYHADFHVNKLLLEATQLLNTMLHEDGHDEYAFYGSTHINHPCQLWLHESGGNIAWTLNLIAGLQHEKEYRWDSGTHTSYEKIIDNWFEDGTCILPYNIHEPQTTTAIACGDLTDSNRKTFILTTPILWYGKLRHRVLAER